MKQFNVFYILFLLIPTLLYGFGSVEEAKFTGAAENSFLSPENNDGKFDSLRISFKNNVEIPDNLRITEFFFRLYNQQGVFLFEISNQFDKAREIPDFTFDGKSSDGTFLKDGIYVYTVGILDEKKIESISQPYTLVVDNTNPEVFYSRISSANVVVPGEEETALSLELEASSEVEWYIEAENTDTSNSHVLFSRKDDDAFTLPSIFEWLGNDLSQNPLPDGNYVLNIRGEDRAGNKSLHQVSTKVIVSSDGSFLLHAMDDDAYFSPNQDGVKDVLELRFSYPQNLRAGIDFTVEEFVLQDLEGREITRNPADDEGERIPFYGLFLDGNPIPDGDYLLHLELKNNDIVLQTNKVPVFIDTAEPLATFSMQTSPQQVKSGEPFYFGGKLKNKVDIRIRRLDSSPWNVEIKQGSQVIYSGPLAFKEDIFMLSVLADTRYLGNPIVDGLYEAVFFSTDKAGNTGRIGPYKAIKDTRERTLDVQANTSNVSALVDPIIFEFTYDQIGVENFSVLINNSEGRVVRNSSLPYGLNRFEWYARTDVGLQVSDGVYDFTVSVRYFNGDEVTKTINNILVDSVPPSIQQFQTKTVIINPNSTSERDRYFEVTQRTNERDAKWTVEIRNIFDQLVYSIDMDTQLQDFRWDGKSSNGETVVDGDYIYSLVGTDSFGNEVLRNVSFIVDSGDYDGGIVLQPGEEFPKIYFPAYSDDIFSLTERGLLYDNLLFVRSVSRLLKAYPQYTLTVVGHAARLLRGKAAEREQLEVLIPLSRARSSQIKKALQILGIDETRLDIRAVGGAEPQIERPNADNIWRNRRVEFELVEKN